MGNILVAPDKFKGSLTAAQVAAHVAAGVRDAGRDAVEVPVADGGEGTLDAAVAAGFTRVPVTVSGPTGLPVRGGIAVDGDTAVVELAAASGLALLPAGPDPLRATSRGTGELVRAALDAGATTVVLGVGGSACTDGGAGMLAVLGARPRPGIEVVLDLVGFADRLAGAALVVTGEGALDEQTLHGKAPAGVAAAARAAGVPVVAVCGRCELDPDRLAAAGIGAVHALVDSEPDVARCLAAPGPLLRALGAAIAASAAVRRDRHGSHAGASGA